MFCTPYRQNIRLTVYIFTQVHGVCVLGVFHEFHDVFGCASSSFFLMKNVVVVVKRSITHYLFLSIFTLCLRRFSKVLCEKSRNFKAPSNGEIRLMIAPSI